MNPVILNSVRKHGIGDEDMLHAYRNPIRLFDLGDVAMLIGADESGRVLEVGIAEGEDVELIVHAMPAGSNFMR